MIGRAAPAVQRKRRLAIVGDFPRGGLKQRRPKAPETVSGFACQALRLRRTCLARAQRVEKGERGAFETIASFRRTSEIFARPRAILVGSVSPDSEQR